MNTPELWAENAMRGRAGLISRARALTLGMTRDQIDHRLASGQWEAVHRGIYRRAAAPVTPEQLLLAACMAAGPQATASHLSAAWMWRLVPRPPPVPALTVPESLHPVLRGVAVHRSRDLDPSRTIERGGIPCTDPLRVLSDLAGELAPADLIPIADAALTRRLLSVDGLVYEAARRSASGRRGPAALRRLLQERGLIGAPAPSALEAETMVLLRRWRIPVLGREVRFGNRGEYRIDFSLSKRVMAEVDGYAYHWSPEAKAHDEARRNELRLMGLFVLVYTWMDIRREGRRVASEINRALRQHPGPI